jgi:dihydrofolate reductase
MKKIVACLFVSVDGVVGEPADWLRMSEDLAATVAARAASTDTILLGRVTYEEFASKWPSRSGAMADLMNTTRKVVVSTSLDEVCWQNAALLDGNAPIGEQLARLRDAPGKDILVLGSATLVQCLLRRGMIDELVLVVRPVIKGRGRRLFDELKDHAPLRQVGCVTLDRGVVSLSYEMDSLAAAEAEPGRGHVRAPGKSAMNTTPDPSIRELDQRVDDRIDVKLLWNSLTDRVWVVVKVERTGEIWELDVDPEDALIAFDDPHAYANGDLTDSALRA